MKDSVITNLTIQKATKLLSSKQIKAKELAIAILARAQELNGKLNAFITICQDQAIDTAEKIDHLIAQGQKLNPLAGIPIAVKDLFSTRGTKTTAGSKVLENYVPVEHAEG